jgi:hypothetical protein
MPSSNVFRQNLFRDVVLCVGVHPCGGRHELLLVPCNEVLPGGHLDGWDGGQVRDVDRDDIGRVTAAFSDIAALASLTRGILGQAFISHTSKQCVFQDIHSTESVELKAFNLVEPACSGKIAPAA